MPDEPAEANDGQATPDTDMRSRRRLLKVAAVGIGAAGLAVTTHVEPALADDPNDLTMAQTKTNTTTTPTVLNTTGAATGAQVLFQSGNNYLATNSNYSAALAGWAGLSGTATVGVYGFSRQPGGAGLAAASNGGATLRLDSFYYSTAPTTGAYLRGDVVSAADGVWQCVTAGTPGTWRKLAGSATAGAFHAITPHRVYDSRHSTRVPSGGTRTISIADGISGAGTVDAPNLVPAGATAISVNVTLTATMGGGYLTLYPAGVATPTASTINWSATGQSLANAVQLAVSTGRQITIFGGGVGTTHVILDVMGYYL